MYFFVGKKDLLMKKMFLLIMALTAFSCGIEEVSRRPVDGDGEIWVRPGVDVDSAGTVVGTAAEYVAAVEYFDKYDWRADPGKGEVRCSLVVYGDGVPMMKIPVGDKYEVSSDPESHRIVGGHVYTDYSSDSETVIKKNGKVVLRYSGREVVCGLVEYGDDIYTLGDNRDGDGFAYRRNGEIVLEGGNGYTFGRLFRQNDSICFAYREKIAVAGQVDGFAACGLDMAGEEMERYYFVVNGKVSQVAVRDDIKKVWDIVPHRGGVCYVASLVGISVPVLVASGGMQALSMPMSSEMLTCRIVNGDAALFVEGMIARENAEITGVFWYEDGRSNIFANGMTVSSLCSDGDGLCCILNPAPPYNKGVIYKSGDYYSMPDGYSSAGSRTSAVIDGILCTGLSSLSGECPVIWRDGLVDTLKINGFISVVATSEN